MFAVDNVTVDITSSVLDRLNPQYTMTAPPRPVDELSAECKIINYPGLTPQTLASKSISTGAGYLVGDEDIELPSVRNIGTARLRVGKITRLSPPDLW